MESGLKSVSKLFTERLFRIPDYQRGYSWKSKQLEEFWGDLLLLDASQKHYLGVLTLEHTSNEQIKNWPEDQWLIEKKNYTPYYVVDGQQRLTTIIILIQCITERMKNSTKLNFDSRDDIQAKYVFINKDPHDGSFIFGYERDNPSYEYLKTKILNKTSTTYSAGEKTIYTKNLLAAKQFLQSKINDLNPNQLSSIYSKITQQILFNVFQIEKEIDVHVAFETMNNRGLQLSNLELLKNRLIYLTTRLGESASNTAGIRSTINNSWKTVYFYLGRNEKKSLSDDYFLSVHFMLFFGKQLLEEHPKLIEHSLHVLAEDDFYKRFLLDTHFTVKRLHSSTKADRLTSTALYQYSMDLKRVVEQYYKCNFPEESEFDSDEKVWYGRLHRLIAASNSREIFVILLLFLPQIQDKSERLSILEAVENYFFLTSLLPYRFLQKHRTLKIAHEVIRLANQRNGAKELHKSITDQISAIKSAPGFPESLLEGLSDSGYYGWRDAKYFMFEYERDLKIKAKRKTDKIDWTALLTSDEDDEDLSSIEHILPQTPSEQYWKDQIKGLSARNIRKLTNSLGNLVATSSPRNSSLRNLPFPEKKGKPDRKTGYAYGSYSEIEVSQSHDWGPQQIAERGVRLLTFMENRWRLTIGDENEKKRLLGLDFVK